MAITLAHSKALTNAIQPLREIPGQLSGRPNDQPSHQPSPHESEKSEPPLKLPAELGTTQERKSAPARNVKELPNEYDPNHEWKNPPAEYDPARDPKNLPMEAAWYNRSPYPPIVLSPEQQRALDRYRLLPHISGDAATTQYLQKSSKYSAECAQELSEKSTANASAGLFTEYGRQLIFYSTAGDGTTRVAIGMACRNALKDLNDYAPKSAAGRSRAVDEMAKIMETTRQYNPEVAELLASVMNQFKDGSKPVNVDDRTMNRLKLLDGQIGDRAMLDLKSRAEGYHAMAWILGTARTMFELKSDLTALAGDERRKPDWDKLEKQIEIIRGGCAGGWGEAVLRTMRPYNDDSSDRAPEFPAAQAEIRESAQRIARYFDCTIPRLP